MEDQPATSMPVGEMTIHPSAEFMRALRVIIDDNGGLETEAAIRMAVLNEAKRLKDAHRKRSERGAYDVCVDGKVVGRVALLNDGGRYHYCGSPASGRERAEFETAHDAEEYVKVSADSAHHTHDERSDIWWREFASRGRDEFAVQEDSM